MSDIKTFSRKAQRQNKALERQQHANAVSESSNEDQPHTTTEQEVVSRQAEVRPATKVFKENVPPAKEHLHKQKKNVVQYSRRPIPTAKQKEQAMQTQHLLKMKEYFAEVDDFQLAEETPVKAKPKPKEERSRSRTPVAASPEASEPQARPARGAASAEQRTAEWVTALSPVLEHDEHQSPGAALKTHATEASPAEPGSDGSTAEPLPPPAQSSPQQYQRSTRPERKSCYGLSRRASLVVAPCHSLAGMPHDDDVNARKQSLAPSLMSRLSTRFSIGNHLARLSTNWGVPDALQRLGLIDPSAPVYPAQPHRPPQQSPIAEQASEEFKQAFEATTVESHDAAGQAAAAEMAAGTAEAGAIEADVAAVIGQLSELELTPMKQLLKLCGQDVDVAKLPSMEELIGQFASLAHIKKIGEGTFGEAFKADQVVFKIVPLEGDLLVNGETQKRSEEILAEVAIALTLSRLRESTSGPEQSQSDNITEGFVQTHGLGICCGRYSKTLVKEWHRWDHLHESENDAVDAFPEDQLYVVFVFADGGADLERFELRSFEEAQSILLQTALSLAVAEEACEFEHRDLHWGNLLVRRDSNKSTSCRLRGHAIEASTSGVTVTLIDFTLSRLTALTGDIAFCDLAADPELFTGPKGDVQADTYRRMKKATKNRWQGYCPATNCLWMHYLADVILNLKQFPMTAKQKKGLRDFRKRALGYRSSTELVWDELFTRCWLAGPSN
ncbi:hypothetical protein WJX82_001400 [Trebouxia sp. C0006]